MHPLSLILSLFYSCMLYQAVLGQDVSMRVSQMSSSYPTSSTSSIDMISLSFNLISGSGMSGLETRLPTIAPTVLPSPRTSLYSSSISGEFSVQSFRVSILPAQPTAAPTAMNSIVLSKSLQHLQSQMPTFAPIASPSPTAKPSSKLSSSMHITFHVSLSFVPRDSTSIQSTVSRNVPSAQPTITPTIEPSEPSNQPSNEYSFHASKSFSAMVSNSRSMASFEFSHHVSVISGIIRTTEPTIMPSNKPIEDLTQSPSAGPSNTPTSTDPTRAPSFASTLHPLEPPIPFPTIFPSNSPISVPTMIASESPSPSPSTNPSDYPTISPSGLPTAQPSEFPTVIPSRSPSKEPSVTLTSSPLIMPTLAPSVMPSAEPILIHNPTVLPSPPPSLMPSNTPITVDPTVSPISTPSLVPVVAPGQPSPQPIIRHSVEPSRLPTIDRTPYPNSALFSEYKLALAHANNQPSSIVFANFFYQGTTISGTCSQGQSFFSANRLSLPLPSFYYANLSWSGTVYDFVSQRTLANTTYQCSSRAEILSLVNSIINRVPYVVICGGHSWRVYVCPEISLVPGICVDCLEATCACSSTASSIPGGYLSLQLCSSCTPSSMAWYHVLHLSIAQDILYPHFSQPLAVIASERSITATTNVSSGGYIYCAAFAPGSSILSVQMIRRAGSVTFIPASGFVSVLVTGLSPSASYSVYCFTQGSGSNIMPLSAALATKTSVRTRCCKAILFTSINSLLVANSDLRDSTAVNEFALDFAPSVDMTVSLILTPFDCVWQVAGQNSSAKTIPSNFAWKAGTSSLARNFIIDGSPGCYQLSLMTTYADTNGDSDPYFSDMKIVNIRSQFVSPPPPALNSAYFSNDGLRLFVSFSTPTDRGIGVLGSRILSPFNCSLCIIFPGSSQSTCIWVTSSLLEISINMAPGVTNSGITSLVLINDVISVVPAVIGPSSCPSGIKCVLSDGVSSPSVRVKSALAPITPAVSLSAPATISGCDDIVIDPTASIGAGGRPWARSVWAVQASGPRAALADEISISNFLNKNAMGTSSIVTIRSELLTPNVIYSFTLQLTNFLGAMSSASAVVAISDVNTIPRVSIAGPGVVDTLRGQTLTVVGNAAFPPCAKGIKMDSLNYMWEVYQGLVLDSSIRSISKTSRNFVLPPYTLATNTIYVLKLSLYSSSSYMALASSSVLVSVGRAGITCSVTGGASRSLTYGKFLIVDASTSRDLDYPGATLVFEWRCTFVSINFGSICPFFQSTNGSMLQWDTGLLPSNLIAPSVVMSIAVTASNGVDTSADSVVAVTLIPTPIPSITIRSNLIKVNGDTDLTIIGVIDSSVGSSYVEWAVNRFSLVGSNLTLISRIVPIGSSAIQLVVKRDTFIGGLSYTLTLSGRYIAGSDQSFGSSAASNRAISQITFTVNRPPAGGAISVFPKTGQALNTSFLISTSEWSDDSSDYPLLFSLAYSGLSSVAVTMLKNKDTTTYVNSILGQGSEQNQYKVLCIAIAYDAYSSASNVSTTAVVEPMLNAAVVQAAASSGVQQALNSGDPFAVAQVIGAVTNTINAVNCTVPVSCGKLHRSPCSFTTKTCGKCLPGFAGSDHDSNFPCFASTTNSANIPTRARATAEDSTPCFDSSTCDALMHCLNGKCVPILKQCVNNCTNQGSCNFVDYTGRSIPTCAESNAFCTAVCHCNIGFYGNDCRFSEAEYLGLQSIRDALCVGVYKAQILEDESTQILESRFDRISSILQDPGQLTTVGFSNCSDSLTLSVQRSADLVAITASALQASLDAMSNLVILGPNFPAAQFSGLTRSLAILSDAIADSLAVGQQPFALTTSNIRLGVRVIDSSEIVGLTISPPISDLEQLLSLTPTASIILNVSTIVASNVRVAVLQFNRFPHLIQADAHHIGVFIKENAPVTDTPTMQNKFKRILTSPSMSRAQLDIKMAKIHFDRVQFDSYNSSARCLESVSPYNLSISCPNYGHNVTRNITCDGIDATVYYTCPAVSTVPICATWNQGIFVADRNCSVISYNDDLTDCRCALRTDLPEVEWNESEWEIFGSTDVILTNKFVVQFSINTSTNSSSNLFVLYSVLALMLVAIFGVIFAARHDFVELSLYDPFDGTLKATYSRIFVEFLNTSKPAILQRSRWYEKLWYKVLDSHCWLFMISKYETDSDYRVVRAASLLGRILIYMLSATIYVIIVYGQDSAKCQVVVSRTPCENVKSLYSTKSLCSWDNHSQLCGLRNNSEVEVTFMTLLFISLSICVVSVPFVKVFKIITSGVRNVVCFTLWSPGLKSKVIIGVRPVGDNVLSNPMRNKPQTLNENEAEVVLDLDKLQSFKSTLLRAARLDILTNRVDLRSIDDEVGLVHQLVDEAVEMSFVSSIVKRQNRTHKRSEFIQHARPVSGQRSFGQFNSLLRKSSHFLDERVQMDEIFAKVVHARQVCDELYKQLEACSSDVAREKLLLRQFSLHTFSSFRNFLAEKYFNPVCIKQNSRSSKPHAMTYLCLIWWPVYLFGLLALVCLLGKNLPHRTNYLWLGGIIIALGLDGLMIEPSLLLFKWVFLTGLISSDLHALHDNLARRVKLVMLRTSGLVTQAISFIQLLNPACRVARKYPHLSVARLLMSLNNYDIPLEFSTESSGLVVFYTDYFVDCGLWYWTQLPDIIQDVTLEFFVIIVLSLVLVTLGVIGIVGNPAIPCVIVTLMISALAAKEWHRSKKSLYFVTDGGHADDLDQPVKSKATFKKQWQDHVIKKRRFQDATDVLLADATCAIVKKPPAHIAGSVDSVYGRGSSSINENLVAVAAAAAARLSRPTSSDAYFTSSSGVGQKPSRPTSSEVYNAVSNSETTTGGVLLADSQTHQLGDSSRAPLQLSEVVAAAHEISSPNHPTEELLDLFSTDWLNEDDVGGDHDELDLMIEANDEHFLKPKQSKRSRKIHGSDRTTESIANAENPPSSHNLSRDPKKFTGGLESFAGSGMIGNGDLEDITGASSIPANDASSQQIRLNRQKSAARLRAQDHLPAEFDPIEEGSKLNLGLISPEENAKAQLQQAREERRRRKEEKRAQKKPSDVKGPTVSSLRKISSFTGREGALVDDQNNNFTGTDKQAVLNVGIDLVPSESDNSEFAFGSSVDSPGNPILSCSPGIQLVHKLSGGFNDFAANLAKFDESFESMYADSKSPVKPPRTKGSIRNDSNFDVVVSTAIGEDGVPFSSFTHSNPAPPALAPTPKSTPAGPSIGAIPSGLAGPPLSRTLSRGVLPPIQLPPVRQTNLRNIPSSSDLINTAGTNPGGQAPPK